MDDEILAIEDFRVKADQLAARLTNYRPGDKVRLLIARREKLERLDLTLGQEFPPAWQLEPRLDATPEQKQRLEAWLGK